MILPSELGDIFHRNFISNCKCKFYDLQDGSEHFYQKKGPIVSPLLKGFIIFKFKTSYSVEELVEVYKKTLTKITSETCIFLALTKYNM